MSHEKVETNIRIMTVLIIVAISGGGLFEIIPLAASRAATEAYEGVTPYPAARTGRA